MVDVKVAGMKELVSKMKKLPYKVRTNILRDAVRASAKVIMDEAKRNAPVDDGILANSLKVVKHRASKQEPNIIHYSVVPSSKAFHKLQDAKGDEHYNYGGLVELGSSKMAAQPYLAPAFESKGEESIEVVKDYIRKRLPKEIAKL